MEYFLLWNDILIILGIAALIMKLYPGKKKKDPEVEDDDIE